MHPSQPSAAAVPAMRFRRDRQVVRARPMEFLMALRVHAGRALFGDYL